MLPGSVTVSCRSLLLDIGSHLSSNDSRGDYICLKMLNPCVHGSIINTAEAHNSGLLPPHYMTNVVLRLKPACMRSIAGPETSELDSSQRRGGYCGEQPEKALLTCCSFLELINQLHMLHTEGWGPIKAYTLQRGR